MNNFFKKHFFSPGWLETWRPFLVFLIFGFLLYGQAVFFNFTYLDDQQLILDNAPILSEFKNIGKVFTDDVFFSTHKFYYRPLLNVSFMIDFSVAGALAVIFHLTNIILHVIVTSLIFLLFCRLNYRRILSFWLAMFFMFHPVLVQAVAWIPGRNDSLLTIFILASFICFLEFKEKSQLGFYLAYAIFFLAALLTKENAVFLPFLVMFYSFFIESNKIIKRDKGLLFFISAVIIFIWFLMRSFALAGQTLTLLTMLESIVKNSPALLVFLGKSVFPFSLSVLPVLADAKIIYGLIVAPLLIIALFFSRQKRYNYIIFGAAWFLLFILPSFIRTNLTDVPDFLEHRLYLPLIGLLIIFAEVDWLKKLDFKKKKVQAVIIFIFSLFAFIVIQHSLNFKDSFYFWESAAEDSPHSPLAQRNLGVMYYFNNDEINAEKYYRKALDLNPNEPMAHNNIGVIYMEQSRYREAENEFTAELNVNPGYDKAISNLNDLKTRENSLLILKNPLR